MELFQKSWTFLRLRKVIFLTLDKVKAVVYSMQVAQHILGGQQTSLRASYCIGISAKLMCFAT